VEGHLGRDQISRRAASEEDVTTAFWQACHGGQLETARRLLDAGADINWVGWNDATPLDIARTGAANKGAPTNDEACLAELVAWLESRGAQSSTDASVPNTTPRNSSTSS
jgi:hypothetical protein